MYSGSSYPRTKKETVVCGVRPPTAKLIRISIFSILRDWMQICITKIIATGKVYTGAALMKAGLPLPLTTGDYQPIRFTFKAVEK